MPVRIRVIVGAALLASLAAFVFAQSAGLPLVQVLPADLKFTPMPNGTLQAPVVGDSTKPGLYAIRVRIPAGTRLLPHFHPDERIVAVLGGTLYVGYGEQFDEQKMKAMPPGSVFTEPPKQPHYTWAKDAGVVLHITGIGPSGTTQIGAGKQ
jgi:quercetin dioxygenase-like cupin family protein